MNKKTLIEGIIKRLSEECELRPSEVLVLLDYIKQLEEENFNLREGIYIEKMSFPSEGRNFKELMEMPTYQELQEENRMLKQANKNTYESSQDMLGELSKGNKELQERIDKAIKVIHTQMKLNPPYKENLKIIENYLIKGSCSVYDLVKDSNVNE